MEGQFRFGNLTLRHALMVELPLAGGCHVLWWVGGAAVNFDELRGVDQVRLGLEGIYFISTESRYCTGMQLSSWLLQARCLPPCAEPSSTVSSVIFRRSGSAAPGSDTAAKPGSIGFQRGFRRLGNWKVCGTRTVPSVLKRRGVNRRESFR